MKINSIYELAKAFGTTQRGLSAVLSDRAGCPVEVWSGVNSVRLTVVIEECCVDYHCMMRFPCELYPITTWIDTIGHTAMEAFCNTFDDPLTMLLNTTEPGEQWTIEDAGHVLSEAEAHGWHFPPSITPEDILAIYNDLEPEKEDE